MKRIYLSVLPAIFTLSSFAQNIPSSDTIALTINEHNTIFVKAVFNKTDTLDLNFDTGTTELTLTNEALKNKLKKGIALYNTVYQLKIGNHQYQTKVYDAQLSGHGTDGRFGWDFFKDSVVEINYDKNILVIHPRIPDAVSSDNTYTKLNITYKEGLPFIVSSIIQNETDITDSFLFDTGYQRTAMLDNDLLKAGNFPTHTMQEIKRVIMKGGQGNEVPVITSNLDLLRIGSYELKNVPVQQITGNKPMRGHNIHILGNEVLKRFNTFLDFKNNTVYLKPNKLYNEVYIEKQG